MIGHTGSTVSGSMHTIDGKGVVRMESRYDTSSEDLWEALTDPGRLARWIADVQGDLRVGGTFDARFTSGWTGPGRVDVCEPPHRLLVTLDPGPDSTVIEATLTADGDAVRLVVEERGLPVAELTGHAAGWQAHIEDLGRYLQGIDPADWRTRWTELIPDYQHRNSLR